MDFQPCSLLPRICVRNRLELHDRLADPCRSRGIPHSMACLENTRNHEPDNFPHGTSPPPTRPELRACSRTNSVHHFQRDHLCHVRKILTRNRISLRGNTRDSNLLWARRRMLLIRSRISCFELPALGRDLIQYSHTSSLGSGSRSLVL